MDDSLKDALAWLSEDENPWGVRVLDVRPYTHGMLSTSNDPQCAQNAVSFFGDDGAGWIGQLPTARYSEAVNRRYKVEGRLYEGPLFIPDCMEHKWAIFYRQGRLIFVRSWLREVYVVADVTRISDDEIEVTQLYGDFGAGADDEGFDGRVLDFLLRTHVLGQVYPAPLPSKLATDEESSALWCVRMFGKLAWVGALERPVDDEQPPEEPLRSYSLLHLAATRGDRATLKTLLEQGWPLDILANDGLSVMHWAVAGEDPELPELLISLGADVDMPSIEGATALMNVVQNADVEKVERLIALGAEVNRGDLRGFTALHRACEMGHDEVALALLDHGADPTIEVQGHSPRSLALMQEHQGIVALIDAVSHMSS